MVVEAVVIAVIVLLSVTFGYYLGVIRNRNG
jgi:hypothetical protein